MFRIRPPLPRLASRLSVAGRPWTQSRCASVGRPVGSKDHWTPEKLATRDEYPLTVALSQVMHPSMATRKTRRNSSSPTGSSKTHSAVHVRTQIVSPGLCDDVLKHIGQTLEQHKGCDILDINPGACLWSQKLHDVLQPRSHVLLEPSPELFQSFLDPLLNAPASKYKLVAKDPLEVQTYRQMVDEGVFAHQTRVGPADGNAQDANNTLLVTGSLMWDPNLAGMGFDSMAKQLYHHFSGATWTNDLFHAYGPVRTLFWVQTDDFSPMIAQASVGMQRGNQLLEMTQNMSLVVHSARKARAVGRGALGREPQYELESLVRALRSGRERGMDVAPHRRDVTYDLAKHIEESSGGTGISSVDSIFAYLRGQQLEGKPVTGLLLQSMIENIELEERLRSEHPDLPVDLTGSLTPTATRFVIRGHPAEKEITKFRKARAQITGVIQHKLMIEAAADLGEEMYRLECKALKMTEGSQKDSLIKQIEHLDMQWDQAITKLTDNYQSAPLTEVDDRISLRYPPYSRSQWDRRSFEPLIAHEYEAWPRNRISLVSASPKPKPRGDSDDWYEWALDFVHAIYDWPNRSIPVALDSMQHGLSDLVKDCPSLRDPDNGGRLQMKHLRVRMLTMKMIHELVQAYKNWPFKAPGTGHCRYFRHKGNRSTR